MQRKDTLWRILLPSIILIPIILLLLFAPKNGWGSGNYVLTGRYIETTSGQHMIYRNTDTGEMRYVFMLPDGDPSMFDAFETGDPIRVQSEPLVQETDDGIHYARVYEPEKIRNSAKVPELTEEVLAHVENLSITFSASSGSGEQTFSPASEQLAIDAHEEILTALGIVLPSDPAYPNYPDNFGGAYYQDGKLHICLTDNTRQAQQTYASLVSVPSVLVFESVEYSYNDLYKGSMLLARDPDLSFSGIGVDVIRNAISVGTPVQYTDEEEQAFAEKIRAELSVDLPVIFTYEGVPSPA